MSVVLWLLQSFDRGFNLTDSAADSILGYIGSVIAPIFRPLGFGQWQAAVALLTGLVAKEAVVASLSMFYGFALTAESTVVAGALSGTFTTLSAFSFLIFILMYVPCVAAVAAIRKEMGSWKWTFMSIGWQIFTAYTCSLLAFQLAAYRWINKKDEVIPHLFLLLLFLVGVFVIMIRRCYPCLQYVLYLSLKIQGNLTFIFQQLICIFSRLNLPPRAQVRRIIAIVSVHSLPVFLCGIDSRQLISPHIGNCFCGRSLQ